MQLKIPLLSKRLKYKMAIKIKQKFPLTVMLCMLSIVIYYNFSYLFPFTNNAFVVANVRPVAADVSGYITDIYVKNEAYVKKGQPLFTVFKRPYELQYQKAISDVDEANAQLQLLKNQLEKTQHAVSTLMSNTSLKDKNAALSQRKALEEELELNQRQIIIQEMKINSLIAVKDDAKVNLDATTVYARSNGVIQDMFVGLGSPTKRLQPLFSFVETDTLFIQANFNENDLRNVKPGDKVSIFPRMYLGSKVYHGTIFSNYWSVSRLFVHKPTELQIVLNTGSNWFLLPQRLPVQIQINDYDAKHYPLNIGASAYVYIHTR